MRPREWTKITNDIRKNIKSANKDAGGGGGKVGVTGVQRISPIPYGGIEQSPRGGNIATKIVVFFFHLDVSLFFFVFVTDDA